MPVRRTVVTATVFAATGLALAMGAVGVGGEAGIALRLRCLFVQSAEVCRDLARERENRALEAVETELRDLTRPSRPACVDPGADTTTRCLP